MLVSLWQSGQGGCLFSAGPIPPPGERAHARRRVAGLNRGRERHGHLIDHWKPELYQTRSGGVNDASAAIGMAVLINDLCPDYATASRAVNECAPGITTHPSNTTTTTNATETLSVAPTGSPTSAYQWQVSTNNGTTWTSLQDTAPYSGVTSSTLRVTRPAGGLSGYQYRAVATNAGGSATSTAATLTVSGTMTATPAAMLFGATVSGTTRPLVTSAQTVSVTFDGAASAWTAASNRTGQGAAVKGSGLYLPGSFSAETGSADEANSPES